MKNNTIARPFSPVDQLAPYRIASSLRIASFAWIGLAIIYVVGRLESLSLGPWDSVRVAALVIGPGAAGVLVSLIVESVRFSDRNP